jgi:hypothetical protein
MARRVAGGPLKIFAGTYGEQFGIPEPIYQALSEFAREVWHLAKVRAVSVERNKDARTGEDADGVTCTLQGPGSQAYRITIWMAPPFSDPTRVKRFPIIRFDVGKKGQEPHLFRNIECFADADDYHNWRMFVLIVLDEEGFDNTTPEEVYRWHRQHGLESKLFHSKEDIPKERFDWVDSKARVQIHSWAEIAQLPSDTVYVGRSPNGEVNEKYPWGNPYKVKQYGLKKSLRLHGKYLECSPELVQRIKFELHGKNLACWCPFYKPCHADILLKIANAP